MSTKLNSSLLQLGKEELKIKKPTRRRTNYNAIKRPYQYNDIVPKKMIRSHTKDKKNKIKSLNNSENKGRVSLKLKEEKIKKVRHITSKELFKRKININNISINKGSLRRNKTMAHYKKEKETKKEETEKIVIDLELKKEKTDSPNLRKIEYKIFDAINKMKNNYKRNSLMEKDFLGQIELFQNDDLINNDEEAKTQIYSPKTNLNNITKNSLFKRKLDNTNNNINNSLNSSLNSINKMNDVVTKDKDQQEIMLNSINYSEYNNLNKLDKKDRIRNIKRIKQIYDSFDDDESEKDNDDFQGSTISSKSNILIFFDLFMFLSSTYYLFYIPLRMAKFDCFCNDEHIAHKCILYIIDILFIFDLCISFFRGYYNYQFKLIKNNRKIFIHYLKTDFLFDLLEAMPIFTYSNFLCMKNTNVHYCFSNYMSYSLIMLRILTSIKIMKIFKVRNKQKNVAFNYFFNLFSENYSLEKIIDNINDIIFCLLAFHFFVCLNIFISKQTYPNWIHAMELNDKSLLYIYIGSSYSLIETLTTVGYGDAVCRCGAERIFQIIILGVGVIAYSYIISAFGNLIKNESESSIRHSNNLKVLESIRVDYPNMTFKLYNKIYNHIESRNLSQKQLDVNFLIDTLPFNLKNSLLLIMYSSIIKHFKFFKKCENSNFIIQVLSKFVPSTNKKAEFVLFEGEMIEEIVFIKDGRLSLEAAIDMEDQENSIRKYFVFNFQGITSAKEMKRLSAAKFSSKTLNSKKPKDFDNAKNVLTYAVKKQVNCLLNENCEDPSILDKTRSKYTEKRNKFKNNNSLLRAEVLKHEPIKNEEGNYKYIKILDLRKNENFGGLYMFLRRPSPLSLKVRSKFAELLLLPKKDVFAISKSFSNIWRKIHNKDFHNMVSIKHKTFKILNKYIEMNGFSTVEPIDISRHYGLDETRRFRFSENNLIFKQSLYPSVPNRKIIELVDPNKEIKEINGKSPKNSVNSSKKSFQTFIVPKNGNLLNIAPNNNEISKSLILKKNRQSNGKLNLTSNFKKSTFSIHSENQINSINIEDDKNLKKKSKTKVDTKIESKKYINIGKKTKTKNETKIENNIEIEKKTKTKVESKNGTKIESKIGTKIESKNGTKIATKIATKFEKTTENSFDKKIGNNKDNQDYKYDKDTKEIKDDYNNTPQQTESLNPSKFTREKILEIKEEMKKSRKKENKRQLLLFGKQTAELFRNKNFTIIFSGNAINNCFTIKNISQLSSKTLNEEKENKKIKNYINMCQNKSFFDKISEISSKDDNSSHQFDKNDLVPEGAISFSYESLYKNINTFTNMRYSKNNSFQEKTLAFLTKLMKMEESNKKINSSFLSDNLSRIKMSESNLMKKDTLSLSGSNSSFRKKYGELLNVKEKNFLQLSTEKSKLKSAAFDDNNKAVINKCRSVKKKNKGKKQNKLQLDLFGSNINEKINEKSMNQSKTKEKNKAKVSPSPLKRKRHTIFKSIHNIKLEENSNIESNIHSNYNNYNQKKSKLGPEIQNKKKNGKRKRNSQVYPAKSFIAFEIDNNNNFENVSRMSKKTHIKDKSIAKKRTTQFHQKSTEKVLHLNNLNNSNKRPSKVIKESLIQSDKKIVKTKNTVNNNNNSLEYFAKEEKEEECIII
jgi:hypothetical protein